MNHNKRFKTRPLSHSQLSTFEYNPEEWYRRYILGEKQEPNPAMLFGSKVGDSIGTPESMVPDLNPPGVKEYELRANIGDIFLIGFADHYCPDTKTLHENKTSDNKEKWNQKTVDSHSQLTMYALLLFLQDKVAPKDVSITLNYIPTRAVGFDFELPDPPEFYQYHTKRTNLQVVEYVNYIKTTVDKMNEYIDTYE